MDDDGYAGPATLTVDGRDLPVRVLLDARHEPHDGKLHWFGRMALPGDPIDPALTAALTSRTSRIELSTATGRSVARVGELDLWGRYRVTGVGPPPFTLAEPDIED
jgi:hypothetical protein